MTPEIFFAAIVASLAEYEMHAIALLALIMLDFLLGVSSAVKVGEFDLLKVAQTYRTTIVPLLIGWGAVAVTTSLVEALAQIVSSSTIPPEAAAIFASLAGNSFWLLAVAQLGASIAKSSRELMSPVEGKLA